MRFKGLFRGALVWALALELVGCAPLPGRTLDPMAPALGLPEEEGRGRSPDEWIGWYRDSRGEGKISLILTRERNTLRGIWQLETGEAGHFAGTLARDSQTFAFTMQGNDHRCPAAFAGSGEYMENQIRGTYTGSDCLGAVEGGSLELERRGSR